MEGQIRSIEVCDNAQIVMRVYETFCEILINEPNRDIVRLGLNLLSYFDIESKSEVSSSELAQIYYDRFFITSSPVFVPSTENAIRHGRKSPVGQMFGAACGKYSYRVEAWYHTIGFDYRALKGFEPIIQTLQPDSLISEIGFLAFLKMQECLNAEDSAYYQEAYRTFLKNHIAIWVEDYAKLASAKGDDLYASVIQCLTIFILAEAA